MQMWVKNSKELERYACRSIQIYMKQSIKAFSKTSEIPD